MVSKKEIPILVIDEDSEYLESLLPCYGYDVTCIKKADEAVGFLSSQTYFELVILDVDISNGAGWTILREIKMNPYLSDIPVLILTSSKDNNRMMLGLQGEAQDYIVKPFLLPNLISKIENILGHSKRDISNIDIDDSELDNILTNKEKDVLLLLIQGYNARSISEILDMDKNLVKTIMSSVYVKLNISEFPNEKVSEMDINYNF